MKEMPMRIELSKIKSNDLQIRVTLDSAVVEDYASQMREGVIFPPVEVFHNGNDYFLADGCHRVAASKICQFLDIDANVQQGTRADALWCALGANRTHGLRLNRADIRKKVELAVREFPTRSLRDIARQIGCGDQLVREVRTELESNCVIHAVEKTVGADGKRRPSRRKAKSTPVGIPAESPIEVSRASTDTLAVDSSLESNAHDASAPADQPVEQEAKPVGMEIATQALELLRTIPADDTQRMQAITLISRWLIEVTTASGCDGNDRPGEVVDLAPGGAVQ